MKYTGVIEGFYGRPWTIDQRLRLIDQYVASGSLNTYVYAPKHDPKHRQQWRVLYSSDQLDEISQIIKKCKFNNMNFIYAISPGLDITYSSIDDSTLIKSKLEQLIELGIHGIAILFDDIPENINNTNSQGNSSFAHAQADISNNLKKVLKMDHWFFCPTVYCSDQTRGLLDKNNYLIELSRSLHTDFNLLWTGPHVISPEIKKAHILELKSIFKHPVVIWDNLFANDYDLHRCFMGPYSGREEIKAEVDGILLNPNCEFELNYIPIHTFADYCKGKERGRYEKTLNDWFLQFNPAITRDELQLMTDTFHLPHTLGEKGKAVIEKVESGSFEELAQSAWDVLQNLSVMENRALFHALYPYAWEFHSIIKRALKGHKIESLPKTSHGSLAYLLGQV